MDETSKPRERRLADVVREMRTAEADRLDQMDREGEVARARLNLLVEELDEVFEEAGGEEAGFDFQIGPGPNPRLWIDAATHVVIGRDGRTFRILRDSRGGRTILGETDDLDDAADHVTRYIATRSLERERLVDEPTVVPAAVGSANLNGTAGSRAFGRADGSAGEGRAFGEGIGRDARPRGEVAPEVIVKRPSRTGRFMRALIWFTIGMLTGAALAFLAYGEQLGFANPVPANLRQIYEPYVPPAPGGVAVPAPIEGDAAPAVTNDAPTAVTGDAPTDDPDVEITTVPVETPPADDQPADAAQ